MLRRIDACSASIEVQGESGGIGAGCRHPLASEETRSVGAVRRVSPLFLQARVPLSPAVRLQVAPAKAERGPCTVVAMDFLNRDGSLTEGWDTHDVHHPIFVSDSLMPRLVAAGTGA